MKPKVKIIESNSYKIKKEHQGSQSKESKEIS